MHFYLFGSPDKTQAVLFRKFVISKNVATARMLSVVMIIICAGVQVSKLFIDYSAFAPNYLKHKPGLFLLAGSAAYYISYQLLKRIRIKHNISLRQFFSVSYAVIFLVAAMWLTFLAQNNPKNTMTFFLLGTFTVSVLWVLEVWEALLIVLLTLSLFYLGLHYFQTDPVSFNQNYIVAVLLVAMFFGISRVTYSYQYSQFQQLKLIELKNREISLVNNTQRGILNVVGHDLRSPINNITAIVHLLEDHSTTESERQEYYRLILNSTREADHIIHDLVGIANDNGNELKKTEICLNDFIRNIHSEWEYRLPDGQSLLFNEPFSMVNAYIHPNKMRRVLNNLIDNAIKFTPQGGLIILELKKLEDKVRITVNDNGIGIPAELQPFLFDRFTNAGRPGLKGERSYGLGLSICLQIVREHGGELHIESREKEGSSFHIDIPLEPLTQVG